MSHDYRTYPPKISSKSIDHQFKCKKSLKQVTFVELGSYFYNCPFREAEESLM